ncbi:MAG: hypothetical protein RIC87_06915 [Kiloniellales bacterium]
MTPSTLAERVPPITWFAVSAVFHYLGPAFAVLLFPAIGVLGIAWLRIASAALLLAPIARPWRAVGDWERKDWVLQVALGATLAAMNATFYLALDRLPMSLVASIEFVGVVALALVGLRSRRNLLALALTVAGVGLLIDVTWSDDLLGLFWASANGLLFVAYVVLGHRLAASGASRGVSGLGTAMAIAMLIALPFGIGEAWSVIDSPLLLLAGIGVGLCSSVIPYICDQLAMSRLPRASFALLLSILPASATLIAAIVLAQIPSVSDLLGIGLVMLGVATHKPTASARAADQGGQDQEDGEEDRG